MVKNQRNQLLVVVVICAVVVIIASFMTASITGNAIWSRFRTSETYTREQVNQMISQVEQKARETIREQVVQKGDSCVYIDYKYGDSDGKRVDEICSNLGKSPVFVVQKDLMLLYNHKDCSPSYQIFSSSHDSLLRFDSYTNSVSPYKLGLWQTSSCGNAVFPDGSSNADYSQSKTSSYEGVLCCLSDAVVIPPSSGGGDGGGASAYPSSSPSPIAS